MRSRPGSEPGPVSHGPAASSTADGGDWARGQGEFDQDGSVEATSDTVVAGPRRGVVIGALAVAGLVAAILAWPGNSELGVEPPPSTAGHTDTRPEITQPLSREPLRVDEVQLLNGSDRFAPSMVLVDPTNRIEGEQAMRIINLEGRSHVVPEPVFIGAWLWPSWPGASVQPFVTAGDHIVFQSRGRIITSSLTTEIATTVGDGMLVLDGAHDDDYWIVGRDEQWVSRRSISNANPARPIPFGDVGRPLAAAGDGLIVDPRDDSDVDGLAMWYPGRGLEPLPLAADLELLGVTGDLLVLGKGNKIVKYHLGSGRTESAELDADYDMHRSAVSPDGKRLALHQYHGLTTLGEFVIIDLETGKTTTTIEDILSQELQWTSAETVVSLKVQAQKFQVIQVDVVTDEHTAVATLGIPWIYVAVLP